LDQELSPRIDEVRQERQIHHLRTNILAPEKTPRPSRQRKPAKHRETNLARSEEQREDIAIDLKDQTTHVAITSEA
jgi:hypothetical protein